MVGATVRDAVANEADRVVVSKHRLGRQGLSVSGIGKGEGKGKRPEF